MSIRDEIKARVKEGQLFFLSIKHPSDPNVRAVFVSKSIKDVIDGPWEKQEYEVAGGRIHNALDRFTAGRMITATLVPYLAGAANMARLDKPEDETWDIRIQDPRPAFRVLGRFADKDLFVAFSWHTRKDLGGKDSKEWRNAIEGCKTSWRNLFPAYQPISGENVSDYISKVSTIGDP